MAVAVEIGTPPTHRLRGNDPNGWVLERATDPSRTPKHLKAKATGKRGWVSPTFHATLGAACARLLEDRVLASDADDVQRLAVAIDDARKALRRDLRPLLDVAGVIGGA